MCHTDQDRVSVHPLNPGHVEGSHMVYVDLKACRDAGQRT